MADLNPVKGAHLVGSVSLEDTDTVINSAVRTLGRHLGRIPDGETGPRQHWAYWQFTVIQQDPSFEQDPEEPPRPFPLMTKGVLGQIEIRPAKFKSGIDLDSVKLNTTYAEHALSSYRQFDKLKKAALVPPDTRFMVALPTPLAIALPHISPTAIPDFLKVYERSLLEDVEVIVANIPASELSIQWDIACEVIGLEGGFPIIGSPQEFEEQCFQQFARMDAAIPPEVEMGYHWCYGNPSGEHVIEPEDASLMVRLSNGVVARSPRTIDYIHMPVPIERTDDAFFAPFANLNVPEDCQLYLGLVHIEDGIKGAEARISAARKYVREFGVATECGLGRHAPEEIEPLLEIHAGCAAPIK